MITIHNTETQLENIKELQKVWNEKLMEYLSITARNLLTNYLSGRLLIDYKYTPEQLIGAINMISEGCGVEDVKDESIASQIFNSTELEKNGDAIASFVNYGHSDCLTVFFCKITEKIIITTVDDYLAEIENIKAIASEISNFCSNYVQWDEWRDLESDTTAYFPIRLQLLEGEFIPRFGDSSFDTNHQGHWTDNYISDDMTDLSDILGIAIAMYRDLIEKIYGQLPNANFSEI